MEAKASREYHLKHFQTNVEPLVKEFGSSAAQLGVEIVDLAKQKDLTYEQAYAGLEYAYDLMHYHQNFLQAK
ncbi:hypothetical protein [Furfurilactobacillus milii]|uniref:Uncharacterized protein n=1 Tax=Furfurilactobacillus milii TaxID=2888272 RepID=A0ABT6DCM7_9LACO|nr:hypothetical protein [Furfurilactobacillus milii]QLE66962.1 putative phage-associated protein [Furfurilactobacillus rossiae]MCF6161972.1 hypothetical protein [Furfurilactobacillus milii]MCF6164352.1 hypothetical protein [Furfurilactobacillus milii]MDF9914840.1 hypothetical protein [Furfurilactobacillus milii]QLE69392.1 putative phage-associated protein [Furfurilactobacillus rossiae]